MVLLNSLLLLSPSSPNSIVCFAVQVGLDVLQSCFPSKMATCWTPKLKEMIPSFGEKLNSDAYKARQNMAATAIILELWEPEEAAKAEKRLW